MVFKRFTNPCDLSFIPKILYIWNQILNSNRLVYNLCGFDAKKNSENSYYASENNVPVT